MGLELVGLNRLKFVDVAIGLLGAALIVGGARAIVRRQLQIYGQLSGRRYSRTFQGWPAVVGGLGWIVVGVACLWAHFRR